MSRRTNSNSLRLFNNKNWDLINYSDSHDYSNIFFQDLYIKDYIENILLKYNVFYGSIIIKRIDYKINIYIYFYNDCNLDRNFQSFYKKVRQPRWKRYHKFYKYVADRNVVSSTKEISLDPYASLRKLLLLNLTLLLNCPVNIHCHNLFIWNKKLGRSIFQFNRKLRSPLLLQDSLRFVFLLRTSFILRNPSLLACFLSANLNKYLGRGFRFFFFLRRIVSRYVYLYNLKGVRIKFKGRFSTLKRIRRSKEFIIQYGKLPLTTLNANIKYSHKDCYTFFGVSSIKIWFYF
jgi:ribosomal protein S3